ncbi:glycosyltransferase family 2 protein [Flagellimonas sediminis]|uniref:Glycosyltransferase n=1 Tax=Flagellimonas sediminis TaxID=2696468 RepID=A0A6I5KWJ3_9FLAO|nr:glycosyltransferase family 2 protein [Allomuricauda sediminis]NDV42742.1 glycosyltransferase [Allomuricauda sediminis]
MDLSIIIPAYNSEAYIENCLSSILNQKLPKERYEVIVVNDGSTDATKEIVEDIAKQFGNINLINQENKGLGGARNIGFDISTGRYVYFLDADDYVASNTLGKLIDIALAHDLDILGFRSKKVMDGKASLSENIESEAPVIVITGREYLATNNYKPEVWWYFTKKDFFLSTKVRHYDRRYVQDSYITPTLFSRAKRIAHLPYDVHRYLLSPNSITRNRSAEHLTVHLGDLDYAVKKLNDLITSIEKEGDPKNAKCLYTLNVKKERYVFVSIIRYIRSNFPYSRLKEGLIGFSLKESYPMRYFPKTPSYNSLTNRTLVFVFNSRPLLYLSFRCYRFAKVFKGK